MVLNLPWAQKWVLWVLEKSIFWFFANFSLKKLKPFSEKVRQSMQSHLNQSLVIGRFLQNGFEAILSSETSVVIVWKGHFSVFFANCWVTKWKPFSGNVKQNVQDCLNPNLGVGSLLENDFERILASKASFVSVWKGHFLVFWRFLSDEVETIFWEIKRKRSKLFQSKFGHKKLLRKCLWSYVQLKNECCECLKRAFSVFLQIFHWRSWNHFLGRWGKAFKAI